MHEKSRHFSAIIIGGGFAGIAAAIELRKAGVTDFVILEKSASMGGVWRDNVYPGCACDVPSRFYSFSFEQNWEWSSRYGRQDEILAYLRHCADKYAIAPHMRFSVTVESLAWDETRHLWRIETQDGVFETDHAISAIGLFNRAAYPQIRDLGSFHGPAFHSSMWDHETDLRGKRIAVIGTGASAIQFVPELAKKAGSLFVCQRSPQYVQPKDLGLPPQDRPWYHSTWLWKLYDRYRIYKSFEDGWERRNSHEKAQAARAQWMKYFESAVPDPVLRAKLTPQYPFGCKRMLMSNDWYPALQRPNVELIDTAVDEITAQGIRLADGRVIELDVIVYGTGFTPAQFLSHLNVAGRGGQTLREAWRDGAEAYLGITVPGYPNFFMLYGPNTNGSASILYLLEHQAGYIAQCIAQSRRRNQAIEARSDRFRAFNEEAQAQLRHSVVAADNCQSYFKLPNGKITTQWPWTMAEYHRRTRRVNFDDFHFLPQPSAAAHRREPADAHV
ncbi:MAG: NAD(P)/FAD-dependent oxidoreductase [Alphaproteobacteria bacterium]|nr:NAD(P)/FAD-dependent oxidoreductase [Alphaproteobacteria bacterium]